MFLLSSPLEQFQIFSVCSFWISSFDFSISNSTFIIVITLFWFFNFILLINSNDFNFFFIPSRFQFFIEFSYEVVLKMVVDSIGSKYQKLFPIVFCIFLFILISNIIGLIPFSFTLSSNLIITFSLSLSIFFSINIICFFKHGINFFSLFLPSGSSLLLSFILIPIEIISYIFRPISLSVRLFANMMAGHTLLKVIVGFSWSMIFGSGSIFLFHLFPLFILVGLIGLELAVACIQSYVFTILFCIYLKDSLFLH